jgi:hemolysin D
LKLIRPNGVDEAKFAEAQRLLAGQMAEFSAKQSRIEAETAKREAELRSTQELVNKFEQTVPIARQRAQDFKNLVNQDFVSKHGYLEREQVRIEQEADLANLRSRLKEIEAALRDTRSLRAAMMAETRRINLDSITEGHQNVAALEQELLKAGLRGKLMRLTSPVDGTVQQLAVHTVGGVLTPAQPLMIIVPRDNPLEVEAFLENKDIGFVKPNLDAEVKIETFQYTKYGTIHAKVTSVSHDAINDEKRGLIYSTRVKMEKSSINVDGTPVSLSPGMAVSVEIKTGKRRVIEYFLTPLMQHARESLRER